MKKFLFALLHSVGLTTFVAWWYRKRVVFLCYHGVTRRPTRSPEDPKGLHVNAHRFAMHLDFLQRHYRIIPLRQYIEAHLGGRSLPDYSLVLTFDDGFRNFLTVAAPMLAARNLPAMVFLITDRAGAESSNHLPSSWTSEDDSRYLSWTEARILGQRQDIQFGSHTCSHSGLLTLSTEDTDRELLHSYNDLVRNLTVDMPTLSYPKGQFSTLLASEASKVGYACAVTTDRGPNEINHDLYTLGRTLIGDNDDEESFAVRVSGLRWWLAKSLGFVLRGRAEPQAANARYREVAKICETPN